VDNTALTPVTQLPTLITLSVRLLDTTTPQPVYNIRILSNSNVKALSATASQTLLCEVENFRGESGGFFAVRPRGLYKLGLSPRPELRPIFNSNQFFLNVAPAQNNSNGVNFLQAATGSILGSCGVARCPALYPLYVLPRPRLQLMLAGRDWYVGPGFKKWARLEVEHCQQVSEDVFRCVADGLRIGRYPDLLLEGSRLQWNEDEGKMFVEVRKSFLQCCGSGMFIPDLGSQIQKQQLKRGVKKICCHIFFCSHKFHKIKYYFIFEMLKKKIWANFQRIIEVFTQKNVTKLSKIWVWDPRSGIRKKPIPDSGSRGQKGTESQNWIRNTGFLFML
jgi:hypothetical protein